MSVRCRSRGTRRSRRSDRAARHPGLHTGELPVLEGPRSRAGIPVRDAVDHPDTRRTEHRFLIYDREGNLIESWEQHNHLFVHPHSVAWTGGSTTG